MYYVHDFFLPVLGRCVYLTSQDPDVLEATIGAELEYLEILTTRIEEKEEECNNESDEEGDNVMIRDARG